MPVQETVKDEIQTYHDEHGRKHLLAPLPEPTSDGLHAAAAAEHGYQHHAQHRIRQYTAGCVGQAVHKHSAPVARILGQITHGRHVGGKRTRVQSYDKTKQESRDNGKAVVFYYTLNKLHSTLETMLQI